MSKAKKLYSNAFNFNDFMTGGVDPRTGLYTCSLSLGALVSSGLNGPRLPINLSFSPFGTDMGFGKGWSLALSRYDVAGRTLSLVSGEVYNAIETPTRLVFDDMKLDLLKARVIASGRYQLSYKNGQTEELAVYGSSGVAVSRKLFAANGASLSFAYGSYNTQPALREVTDAQRTLLSIARTDSKVTLTQYPGTPCEAVFTLTLSQGLLTGIRLSTGESWALEYEVVDGVTYMIAVDSPLGAREIIGYREVGHRLLPNAPLDAIRSVNVYTVYPKQGQPPVVTTYEFSDANFLGFGSGVDGGDEGDVLYRIAGAYQYSSTECLMDGSKVHSSTVRTYNKFHLLVSEVTTSGNFRVLSEIDYHLVEGKAFSEQPAQLRLPKTQTLTYHNLTTKQTREAVTHTAYDEAGNLLSKVEPNGITTVSTFYPAEGAEGCPADPLGFVRFERLRTVIPAQGLAAAPTLLTTFNYALQPAMEGGGQAYIVCTQESLYEQVEGEQVLCLSTDLTYINAPQDAQRHGLLNTKSLLQNGLRTQSECDYSLSDDTLKIVRTMIGFDGTSSQQVQIFSSLNGVKLSEQNEGQPNTAFTYDALGRVLSETVAPFTDFTATKSTAYQAAGIDGTPAMLLSTDVCGVQQRVTYDGLGRTIRIEEQDPDNPSVGALREVYSARYDKVGHCAQETHTDWLQGVPLALDTHFDLSANQQLLITTHPNGHKTYHETDQVLMLESQWNEGAGKVVTHLNLFAKPERIETFDRNGSHLSQVLNLYDGLGRCVSQTDPVGNCTTYEFDVFDRLRRSVLPDGHAVETNYAQHSARALPAQVTVAGHSLGHQVFDGLGRLTQSTVGGRVTRLTYEANGQNPVSVQKPNGDRIAYTYERNLGEQLIARQASGLSASYAYDSKLGLLLGCKEQSRESQFEYSLSGRLTREVTVTEGGVQEASHLYSLAGRPLTYIDVLGAEHKTTYGALGLPVSFEHDSLKAELSYNALGQLVTISTRDAVGKLSVITQLAYDDSGREVSRRFECAGSEPCTLESRYTPASKLARRTLTSGTTVERDEAFSYDVRGRLSEYRCSGTQRPFDAYGKEIIKQTYTFDALDNLVTLETHFVGGQNLASYVYSAVDATQLVEITHSHSDYPAPVKLTYDQNGQLVIDERSRVLSYDALGRLTSVASAVGGVIRGYHYDALDMLVERSAPDARSALIYYDEGRLVNEVSGADSATYLRSANLSLGYQQQGPENKNELFGTDQQQSVMAKVSDSGLEKAAYSPYGHHVMQGRVFSLPGFNGEHLDPLTGLYMLGNGYRAYSPELMRFQVPDSLSPFGVGGLNPYAYCLGDPVNRVDPTGHWSWQSILGIALSVVGIIASVATFGAATPLAVLGLGLGIASGLAGVASSVVGELAPQSQAGEILGWVSLGLGIASAGVGLLATRSVITQGGRLLGKDFKGVADKPLKYAYAPGNKGFKGVKTVVSKSKAPEGASPNKWRVAGPKDKNIKEGLTKNSLDEYQTFRRAIETEGLSPVEASKRLGDPKYTVLNKHTNQAEIRIGGKDRVTFTFSKSDFMVNILQVGGHT